MTWPKPLHRWHCMSFVLPVEAAADDEFLAGVGATFFIGAVVSDAKLEGEWSDLEIVGVTVVIRVGGAMGVRGTHVEV